VALRREAQPAVGAPVVVPPVALAPVVAVPPVVELPLVASGRRQAFAVRRVGLALAPVAFCSPAR
jgi:hypothetical protein